MNDSNGRDFLEQSISKNNFQRSCTLYVCTSCRTLGTPRQPKSQRHGYLLYKKIRDLVIERSMEDQIKVQPAECLSVCPRPCGIALSSAEAWTYLFGDQHEESLHEILACAELYCTTFEGFMNRTDRPKSLRRSILGRVPPRGDKKTCI